MSSADRPGRMNSSVGGCGGGEVDGVRSAAGAACFLGVVTARGLTLSAESESELGSSIRCRLAGFGRAGWRVVVVPLLSQGSVLAMTIDDSARWSENQIEGE